MKNGWHILLTSFREHSQLMYFQTAVVVRYPQKVCKVLLKLQR